MRERRACLAKLVKNRLTLTRRSVIFTTNVEFSRWGTVFADDKLAAAIVDRVVHHGRLVEFGGPSHRLEESLMLGKSGR